MGEKYITLLYKMSYTQLYREGVVGGTVGSHTKFTKTLLERLNYNTEMVSTENAIENMKKINPRFNENDIFTLAYLSTNPAIPENDREIFKQCLDAVAKREQDQYELLKQRIQITPISSKEVDDIQKARDILYDI